MSLPEISRRCLACGAAVRRGARFCHQCGADTQKDGLPASDERIEETGASASTTATESAPLELPDTGTLAQTWEQWDESVRARGDGEVLSEAATQADPPSNTSHDFSSDLSSAAATESEPFEQREARAPAVEARPETVAEARASAGAGTQERDEGGRRRPATIVRENLRPRVEKMREASIVVMEDASEDTGLRFVLIAVALFVLFLLFLFVSSFLR